MHNPQQHSNRAASALVLRLSLAALSLQVVVPLVSPVLADGPSDEQRIAVREVGRDGDCPDIKILGAGGVSLLSLSPSGYLGVEVSALTPELRQHFGVTDDAGVMISRVVEGSAAAIAGLAVGDIVTTVEGEKITSPSRLGRVVRGQEGGVSVEIEFWRDQQPSHTSAILEERKRCALDIGDYLGDLDFDKLPHIEGLDISHEALQTALQSARDALHNHDWTEQLENLRSLDLERMEERMQRVQERLHSLEERLEGEVTRKLKRAEGDRKQVEREVARAERERAERKRERERAQKRSDQDGPI